jgi:hypothetical protein
MIIGIILIGLILISSSLKGTEHELGNQLQVDLLGSNGFIGWIVAITLIGVLGYLPAFNKASKYLMLLLFVVIVVQNRNVFANVQTGVEQAVAQGPAPTVAPPVVSSFSGGGGAGSNPLGALGGAVSAVTSIGTFLGL